MFDRDQLKQILNEPSEALNVEIKTWIDPETIEGKVKLVKGLLALRNRNGGCLLIGFNDKTLAPDPRTLADVRKSFHADQIQYLVSRYSSDAFAVTVEFIERDGQEHPVIVFPSGIRVPIAIKADLVDTSTGKKVLREGEVPFRTLSSSGNVSTSAARPTDWKDILEICFENREADIGRFVRRHLGGPDIASLLASLNLVSSAAAPQRDWAVELADRRAAFLERQRKRIAQRGLATEEARLLEMGRWDVTASFSEESGADVPTEEFLDTIMSANPRYMNWSSFIDTRSATDVQNRPQVHAGGWETLVAVALTTQWERLDFVRLEPSGRFYHSMILDDDSSARSRGFGPLATLDPGNVISRVASAMANS
jgi:hypothetical protein